MDSSLSLWEAAAHDDLSTISARLLESDTHIDMMHEMGFTALHSAITSKQFSATQFLIENGADVNLRDKESGYTPLHRAFLSKNVPIVLLLLQNGALLGEEASNGGRPWSATSKSVYSRKANKGGGGSDTQYLESLVDFDGLTPISFLISMPSLKRALAHCVSMHEGGEVYSFGSETADFQLGYALSSSNNSSARRALPHPRRIHSLAQMSIVSISAGRFHSLAVSLSGRVFSWGHGRGGRLGHGDEEVKMNPTMLSSLATEHIVSCAAGENHSMALSSKGGVYCWGSDRFGQLGVAGKSAANTSQAPTTIGSSHGSGVGSGDRFTPRRVEVLKKQRVVCISAGAAHSVAATKEGALYTWGLNKSGQLMRKGTDKSSSHGGANANSSNIGGDNSCDPTPKLVSGFGSSGGARKAISVSAGPLSTIVIATMYANGMGNKQKGNEDRAVYQAGYGSPSLSKVHFNNVKYGSFHQESQVNITSADENDWKVSSSIAPCIVQVSAGRYHSVALCSKGRVYTWGRGVDALGTSSNSLDASTQFSQSGGSSRSHSSSLIEPVLVDAMLFENGCGGCAVEVEASESRTCVVMDDGSIYTWGCSTGVGTLGFGVSTGGGRWQPRPSRIAKLAKAVHVAMGSDHTLVISNIFKPDVEFYPSSFATKVKKQQSSLSKSCSQSDDESVASQEDDDTESSMIRKDEEKQAEHIDIEEEEEEEEYSDCENDQLNRINSRILQDSILSADQKQSLLNNDIYQKKTNKINPSLKDIFFKQDSDQDNKIPSLKSLCQEKVASLVDIDNVTSLSCFARSYHLTSLISYTDLFMENNMDALLVMTKDKWRNMVLEEKLSTTSDVLLNCHHLQNAQRSVLPPPPPQKFASYPKVSNSPKVVSMRHRSNSVSSNNSATLSDGGVSLEENDDVAKQEKSLRKKIKHVSMILESMKKSKKNGRQTQVTNSSVGFSKDDVNSVDSVLLGCSDREGGSSISMSSLDFEISQREEKLVALKTKLDLLLESKVVAQSSSSPSQSIGKKNILSTLSPVAKHEKPQSPIVDKASTDKFEKSSKQYYCEICNVSSQNSSTFASHLLGKKHKARSAMTSSSSSDRASDSFLSNSDQSRHSLFSLDETESSSLLRSSYHLLVKEQQLEDERLRQQEQEAGKGVGKEHDNEWKQSPHKSSKSSKRGLNPDASPAQDSQTIADESSTLNQTSKTGPIFEAVEEEYGVSEYVADKQVMGEYHGSQSSRITLGDFLKPRPGRNKSKGKNGQHFLENNGLLSSSPTKCGWGIKSKDMLTSNAVSETSSPDSCVSASQPVKLSLTAIVEEEEQLRQLAFRHQLNNHHLSASQSIPSGGVSGNSNKVVDPSQASFKSNQEAIPQSSKQSTHIFKHLGVADSRWFVPRTASALAVSDIIQQEKEEQRLKDEKLKQEEAEAKEIEQAIALVARKEAEELELRSKWSCEVCTFLNTLKNKRCEMCSTERRQQNGKQKPSSSQSSGKGKSPLKNSTKQKTPSKTAKASRITSKAKNVVESVSDHGLVGDSEGGDGGGGGGGGGGCKEHTKAKKKGKGGKQESGKEHTKSDKSSLKQSLSANAPSFTPSI